MGLVAWPFWFLCEAMGNVCTPDSDAAAAFVMYGDETICKNYIQLAISDFITLAGVSIGHHTSILVNGEEYFFDTVGICRCKTLLSHGPAPKKIIDVGFSERSGKDMCKALTPYFFEGSYDIILKNCNTFTDCALYYLLGLRLDKCYSFFERNVGQQINFDFIEFFTNSFYKADRSVREFSVELVIRHLREREMMVRGKKQLCLFTL